MNYKSTHPQKDNDKEILIIKNLVIKKPTFHKIYTMETLVL